MEEGAKVINKATQKSINFYEFIIKYIMIKCIKIYILLI